MSEHPPKDSVEATSEDKVEQPPVMTEESQKVPENPPRTQEEEEALEKVKGNLSAQAEVYEKKDRRQTTARTVAGAAGGVAGVGVAYGATGAVAAPVIESGVASIATGSGWAVWLAKTLGPLALFGAFLYKLKDLPAYLEQVAKGEKLKIPAAKGGGGGKKDDHGHGGGGGHH